MRRWSPHSYLQEAKGHGLSESQAREILREADALQRQDLAAILSLNHIAKMTGVTREFLHRIVNREPKTAAYRHFNMKKRGKSNGYRRIHVPHPGLCRVQRWLVDNVLSRISPHPQAYAYVRGRENPIRECAQVHCEAGWLVRMDIEGFFDSIPETAVFEIYFNLGYNRLVAFELARLSTWIHEPNEIGSKYPLSMSSIRYAEGSHWLRKESYGPYGCREIGSLPQGAPTSPMLANLHCRELDSQIDDAATNQGFVYSRYSDDLYFSCQTTTRADILKLIATIATLVNSHGHQLNAQKTSISPPGSRKVVLGLLVDGDRPKLTKDRRQNIRQHIYSIGVDPHKHAAARKFSSVWALIRHVKGLVEFAASIEPERGQNYRAQLIQALEKHGFD